MDEFVVLGFNYSWSDVDGQRNISTKDTPNKAKVNSEHFKNERKTLHFYQVFIKVSRLNIKGKCIKKSTFSVDNVSSDSY